MRNLKLPAHYEIEETLFVFEEDFDEARDLRKLAGRIIHAGSAIENDIADVLMKSIFSEVKVHAKLVKNGVFKSTFSEFSKKLVLLLTVLEEFQLLNKQEIGALGKNLRAVAKYRNAFAHGTLRHNVDCQELRFFSGTEQTVKLDDAYFEKLEKCFLEAWEALKAIQSKLEGEAAIE